MYEKERSILGQNGRFWTSYKSSIYKPRSCTHKTILTFPQNTKNVQYDFYMFGSFLHNDFSKLWEENRYVFLLFLNQKHKLQKFSRHKLLENIIVVDSECVYTKIDEILGEKFNTTTQICCKGSGVHDKYQLGQEVECCGGKKF